MSSIEGLLEQFDNAHPREVATFLLKRGHRGRPGHPRECPLSRYLREALGVPLVEVLHGFVYVRYVDRTKTLVLSKALIDFIDWFDLGEYPELVDKTPKRRPDHGPRKEHEGS